MTRSSVFALTLASALLLPAVARADGSNKAAAQELFDQGRKLMEQGDFAAACPKLESSQKLDPGAGTLMNLAACYEKNGQSASAWVTYTDAATSSAERHPDWAEKARAKAAALAPTLSRLTVLVPHSVPGLIVKRDGAFVASGAYGVPIPVDPGAHVVEATAPGRLGSKQTVQVAAGAAQEVITVPELDAAPTGSAAGNGSTEGRASGTTQRVLGATFAGVGIVGLAFGSIFGVKALNWKSDVAVAHCNPEFTACDPTGKAEIDKAHSDATISTVAFVVGAVALVGGTIVFFTAPHTAEAKPEVSVGLGHRGSPLGLTLEGSF
jgi:serine/threonine-protein kinase